MKIVSINQKLVYISYKTKTQFNPSLFLIKHHTTIMYEGVEVQLHVFINPTLSGVNGQLHVSATLSRYASGRRVPGDVQETISLDHSEN